MNYARLFFLLVFFHQIFGMPSTNKNNARKFFKSAAEGYIPQAIESIVKDNIKLTEQNKKLNNALMIAAQHGKLAFVNWFITELKKIHPHSFKNYINHQNIHGNSALLLAMLKYNDLVINQPEQKTLINDYTEIIKLLIETGADKKIKNKNNQCYDDLLNCYC